MLSGLIEKAGHFGGAHPQQVLGRQDQLAWSVFVHGLPDPLPVPLRPGHEHVAAVDMGELARQARLAWQGQQHVVFVFTTWRIETAGPTQQITVRIQSGLNRRRSCFHVTDVKDQLHFRPLAQRECVGARVSGGTQPRNHLVVLAIPAPNHLIELLIEERLL